MRRTVRRTLFQRHNAKQFFLHTATNCNKLQHSAPYRNTLHYTATRYTTLRQTATQTCRPLSCGGRYSGCRLILPHSTLHCNILQHAATRCNTDLPSFDWRPVPSEPSHAVAHWNNLNILEHTVTYWTIREHTATHCNIDPSSFG